MSISARMFDAPDEVRSIGRGEVQLVQVGDTTVGRVTFQPGWKWSDDVKSIVGTESCQIHHVGIVLSGTLHVVSEGGEEIDLVAGGAYDISPGHDAWVVGDEPTVAVEFLSAAEYAKPA